MDKPIEGKIERFFSQGRRLQYQMGQTLIEADRQPDGVFWLVSGVVEQLALNREGGRICVNIFKPTAFFPMSWAINRTGNQYFYVAATKVEVYVVEVDLAVRFIKDSPEVAFDLLARVYRGADGLLQRLALASHGTARQRLLFELRTECLRFGQKIDDDWWQITITQAALANRSGLARETVSRELQRLKTDEIVIIADGKMHVTLDGLNMLLK